jgi:hypothetical protein
MLLYGLGSIWQDMKIEQMRGKRRSGIGTRAGKEDLDKGCIMDTDLDNGPQFARLLLSTDHH